MSIVSRCSATSRLGHGCRWAALAALAVLGAQMIPISPLKAANSAEPREERKVVKTLYARIEVRLDRGAMMLHQLDSADIAKALHRLIFTKPSFTDAEVRALELTSAPVDEGVPKKIRLDQVARVRIRMSTKRVVVGEGVGFSQAQD